MSKRFDEIYNKLQQKSADEMNLSIEDYREFDSICYQHTQGYYKDREEEKSLLDKYWELISKSKKQL